MRANQSLYPSGAPSFQPDPERKAILVPFADVPKIHFATVAMCDVPFEQFLEGRNVPAIRKHSTLAGGWFRAIGVRLPTGRHATLTMYEAHPGHFDVALQVWRELHVFREDFFLVRELIGATDASFRMCDGPVLWR